MRVYDPALTNPSRGKRRRGAKRAMLWTTMQSCESSKQCLHKKMERLFFSITENNV
jgi:hypothetical protein